MADIDPSHRAVLTDFANQQMTLNQAGIGNECTHWVYAALFEARALDTDATLHIAQSGTPYTWGSTVDPTHVQVGDIAQFHSFHSKFFIFQLTGGGRFTTLFHDFLRGPNHTGMVFSLLKNGVYDQLESHLHQDGVPRMQIRANRIYYEPFAIALSAADLKKIVGSAAWPADVDIAKLPDMIQKIDWAGMRGEHTLEAAEADQMVARIKRSSTTPALMANGADVACLFVVRRLGFLSFSCPQASPARLAMDAAALTVEKADLIHRCILSGRKGGAADEDIYGGDNKKQRLHDHRFDWSYTQP